MTLTIGTFHLLFALPLWKAFFCNVKEGPVGIWNFCPSRGGRNRSLLLYSKTDMSESIFRVKGTCWNPTSEVNETCRNLTSEEKGPVGIMPSIEDGGGGGVCG